MALTTDPTGDRDHVPPQRAVTHSETTSTHIEMSDEKTAGPSPVNMAATVPSRPAPEVVAKASLLEAAVDPLGIDRRGVVMIIQRLWKLSRALSV